MHWFSIGVALLAALGIITLGVMYLANPIVATRSFGLPLPGDGPNIEWWLRLKGLRDIVSGLIVLAAVAWGGPRVLGMALLIEAITPAGDMSLILAARGSTTRALGIHGLTAALMIAASVLWFWDPPSSNGADLTPPLARFATSRHLGLQLPTAANTTASRMAASAKLQRTIERLFLAGS